MMEFTVSRCILMVCGVILMGSVVAPISDYYGHEESGYFQQIADNDARILDAYLESGADEIVLEGTALLPDCTASLSVSGNRLVLTNMNGEEFTSYIRGDVADFCIGYGEVLTMGRESLQISNTL